MYRKIISLSVMLSLMLVGLSQAAQAAPPSAAPKCDQTYSVQKDDWLSKLADKFYGDVLAYPAIALATDMNRPADSSFALVSNPDLIEVGDKLCIPTKDDATALLATKFKILVDTKGPGSGNPFWRAVEDGAKAMSQTWRVVDLTIQAPPQESDVQTQVNQLEDALTKKTQAMVVAATDKVALNSTLDKAKAATVPVLTIDSDADWAGKLSFIGTDNKAGGKLAGQFLCKQLGQGAKVAILEGNMTAQSIADRVAGAKDGLAGCGATIVKELGEPTHSVAGGQKVMEDILTASPDVQGVFCINDQQATGALNAANAAGKKPLIVGFDASDPAVLKIIAGGSNFAASVRQQPANMGRFGIMWAIAALTGNAKDVAARIDTGTILVTKDNAAQFIQ
jgi:ribose transport system substrate-binding protein